MVTTVELISDGASQGDQVTFSLTMIILMVLIVSNKIMLTQELIF